jgi:hypothetical protein
VQSSGVSHLPGTRWLASTGLTGTYKIRLLEVEPSAKVYPLWEHENQYLDSLCTLQDSNNFSTGRARGGASEVVVILAGAVVAVRTIGTLV